MSATQILIGIFIVLLALFVVRRLSKKPLPAANPQASTKKKEEVRAPTDVQSSWDICKSCGERRVIVNQEVGYCAYCWSTTGTKYQV